jgi:endonuclease/exonuclease/phosphatase (EEP) superfamily protein YafD
MNAKKAWRRLGLLTSALVILGALVGLAAPYLVDYSLKFDLLANFQVHFWGVLITAIVALIIRRFWFEIMVLGFVATPVYVGLQPLLLDRNYEPAEVAEGEVAIKVLTLNAFHGNQDVDAIEAYVRAEDADIVLLMEVGRSKQPLIDALSDLFPHREDCVGVVHCHIAVLSKRSFVDSGVKSNWSGPAMVWVRYGPDLSNLTVVGTHLTRIPYLDRQLAQIEELARETLRMGDPVLVAGDFNATEFSVMANAFQEYSGLWRMTDMPTWPNWFFGLPQLGIDHIFISNGILPLAYPRTGEYIGSDHRPVTGWFAISPTE